ncbi:peptidylprolyl isomerase [Nocardioides montaniterrae]
MLKRALAGVPALLLLPLIATAACGSKSSDTTDAGGTPTTPATSSAAPGPTSPAGATTSAPQAAGTTCNYPSDGSKSKATPPPARAKASGTVPAVLHTTVGDLHLSLDAKAAPCTVNSFVSLAKQGFYDGSHCHRLGNSPGFQMLQCGDPTGTGMGGPGYTVPDEITGSETYPAGTLAMANTGQPNSGGSQFFMVFGDTQLPPSYTVFGTFDKAAIDTLDSVAAKGISNPGPDGTGEPKERVEFQSISVG